MEPGVFQRITQLDWIEYFTDPQLLEQLIPLHELPLSDLQLFDLHQLLSNEHYNILLLLFDQFARKPTRNLVLDLFASQSEIGHEFVVYFNKCDEQYQPLGIQLLIQLIELDRNYFYTTDLAVLVDVCCRQALCSTEALQMQYFRLLPLCLDEQDTFGSKEKAREMFAKVKGEHVSSPQSKMAATKLLEMLL
ncbi:hypothetical protein EDD86DRAFT_209394 [Gorgonomyces haynaldii]|nr:hypothetical protein EDD86DRAFT_209394 [Gorgonomyces haynaldii]